VETPDRLANAHERNDTVADPATDEDARVRR